MESNFSNRTQIYPRNRYQERSFLQSLNLLALSAKINIFTTLVFIIIGLIGNSLAIYVFSHKRFRTNSSHVYLLCLAIIDSLFIVIHLIEDTSKTYKDHFLNETTFKNSILNVFYLTDQFELACRLVNSVRYVLRFISAYIVVAFTIQRLSIVYRPLSVRFKTKKSAWKSIALISLIACLMNSWVPFLFHVQKNNLNIDYCDINIKYKEEYFKVNMIYIFLIMLIPIVTILVCNSLIIYKTFRNDLDRKSLRPINLKATARKTDNNCNNMKKALSNTNINCTQGKSAAKLAETLALPERISNLSGSSTNINSKLKVKPHYLTVNQMINKNKKSSQSHSKKLLKTLTLISFSYAFLNMPYLLTWMLYFYKTALNKLDRIMENYLLVSLELSEMFYVLNYCVKFYIYCASGSIFCNQLKYTSN